MTFRETLLMYAATEIDEPQVKTQHDADCAVHAGITRMYGCTCGFQPKKKEPTWVSPFVLTDDMVRDQLRQVVQGKVENYEFGGAPGAVGFGWGM